MSSEKKQLLGNRKKGLLFVMSAPAGTGKTTLMQMLTREFPQVIQSISYCSRKPRSNEKDGVDYHFITEKEFEKKIKTADFLEYVRLYNDYYGTDKKWVEKQLSLGNHVFLVIDTQGAMKLKGCVNAIFIFIKPPSLEVLQERISKRSTDSPESIQKRMAWAEKELPFAKEYDYLIVNDDLETAYQVLRSIVIAEDHHLMGSQDANKSIGSKIEKN